MKLRSRSQRILKVILLNISVEFEDCKKIAKASRVPIKEVMRKVEEAARRHFF
jgi:uncharacterized protein (DUF111 family)